MTIVEKSGVDSPWLFRTLQLQTGQTQSTLEPPFHLAPKPPPVHMMNHNRSMAQQQQQQQQQQQKQQQHLRVPTGPIPVKVMKSSTAPNLNIERSHSDLYRVI